MTVAYDVTALLDPLSGVGHYTQALLAALERVAPQDERRLYAKAPLPAAVAALGARQNGPFARTHAVWLQWHLARHLRRHPPDVAHFTNEIAPIRPGCPTVLSLHDASLFRHPHLHPWRRRLTRRRLIPRCARQATAVLTGTHFARQELLHFLPLDPDRVHVIPYAADPRFQPVPGPSDDALATQLQLPERYILAFGAADPRKNIATLLTAVAHLRRQGTPIALVLAGAMPPPTSVAGRALADPSLGTAVHVLGHVPGHLLPLLYRRAVALAYPSLYEGFGLPILEAMASGTAVVTSRFGAMAEVAGNAAVTGDPTDAPALATAVERLWRDEEWRVQWVEKGLNRAAQFNWQTCARATREIYRQVASDHL